MKEKGIMEERNSNETGESGVVLKWRNLPMSTRFMLRTAAFSLPATIIAGVIFVIVLVPHPSLGKYLQGVGLGFAAGVVAIATAGTAAVIMYVRPVERMRQVAESLAGRDFTVEVDLGKRLELLPIQDSFNGMISSIREIVEQMRLVADSVAGSSSLMASVAKDTSDAVQSTASTVAGLAKGAEDQVNSMMVASSTINQMAEEINRVAEATREVARYSIEARVTVEEGVNAIDQSRQKIERLVETTSASAASVRNLGELSEQVGLIVDVITDIADQTNLLALNAAIEAARAGEHGKGFAVVAGEVRKLAEGSARAASQIASIIREIQKSIGETSKSMEGSSKDASEGSSAVGDAESALHTIKEAVETIGAETHEISQATETLDEGSNKVVEIIGSVASISEESASATQEVSATVEEQTASMEEVSATAAELAEAAERLRKIIEEIRTQ
ncbi:MAG: methyl-accepting chemotaxis protein [Actinomycetota bacterium]|nr:methyl-accepting chemotaxis protein [Actinomycetota bacterium]